MGIGATQMAPVNVVIPARTGGAVPLVIARTAPSGAARSSTSRVVGGTRPNPFRRSRSRAYLFKAERGAGWELSP